MIHLPFLKTYGSFLFYSIDALQSSILGPVLFIFLSMIWIQELNAPLVKFALSLLVLSNWKVLLTLLRDKSPCRERDVDTMEHWAITTDMKMTSQNARFYTWDREMPDTSLNWERASSGVVERVLVVLVDSRLCGSQ